jgi:hypothetical protein
VHGRQRLFPVSRDDHSPSFAEFHESMTPFHLYLYGPSRGPIETSFEEVEARLIRLPLLHFEPDGFFVWTRCSGQQQVSGTIFDAQCKIQYCDLRGQCDHQMWQELCVAIAGGPRDGLEVLLLPNRQLQDLQSFEKSHWPETNLAEG